MKLKHPFITFIGICALLGAGVSLYRALGYGHTAHPWYEEAIDAAYGATIGAACLAYEWRTNVRQRGAKVLAHSKWRHRTELRVALYAVAIRLLLGIPIEFARALGLGIFRAWPIPPAFWEEFRVSEVVMPLVIAIPILVYDRYRIRRDALDEDTIHCRVCGYDLRATPERCPECGTLAAVRHPPELRHP